MKTAALQFVLSAGRVVRSMEVANAIGMRKSATQELLKELADDGLIESNYSRGPYVRWGPPGTRILKAPAIHVGRRFASVWDYAIQE